MAYHICGCYYTTTAAFYEPRHYLPQVQLTSHTTITPLSFTTKLVQTFANPNPDHIPETRYTFPLYDGVAVTSFACTIGDKAITGHVEQKEQARKTYDTAVERGETAGLLESLPLGIFGVTLGNIPAKATIKVNIVYGGELKHDAEIDGLRYILPTSIAPRYGSYPGELLQPDTAITEAMRITVDVNMTGSYIRKVQSPSKEHPIAVSIGCLSTDENPESTHSVSKACISLTHGTTELGEDFILQILVDNISSPKAVIEKHSLSNRQALMTTFVSKFNLNPIRPEIVFIADQSGSMGDLKNTALVAALKTFLKSLPVGIYFNICAFGSTERFLWETSMPYNQDTTTEALNFVQSFDANMGGTELYAPVCAAFEKHMHMKDLPLEVILLTDGQISGEQQLFDYINNQIHANKVDARCFVLGVGGDVSHTLVEGVARAGNGTCLFVIGDEIMDRKVIRMLKAALYPHIKDYTLELEYDTQATEDFEIIDAGSIEDEDKTPTASTFTLSDLPEQKPISLFDNNVDLNDAPNEVNDGADRYTHLPVVSIPDVIQAPHNIPPLFPFNRTTIHLLLKDRKQLPNAVVLRGTSPQGPLELRIPINSVIENSGNVINSLAAKKACQDLEEGRGWLMDAKEDDVLIKEKYPSRYNELVEKEVVRLGVEYQVANKWCSFVAVQDNERNPDSHQQQVHTFRPSGFAGNRRGQFQSQVSQPISATNSTTTPSTQGAMGSFEGGSTDPTFEVESCFSNGWEVCPANDTEIAPAAMQQQLPQERPTMQKKHQKRRAMQRTSQQQFVQLRSSSQTPFTPSSNPIPPASTPTPITEIPTSSPLATTRTLIDLQNFNGSWNADDMLICFFQRQGTPLDLESMILNQPSIEITALVVTWLEILALEEEEVWDLVVKKGRLWILDMVRGEELGKRVLERAERAVRAVRAVRVVRAVREMHGA